MAGALDLMKLGPRDRGAHASVARERNSLILCSPHEEHGNRRAVNRTIHRIQIDA